MRKKLPAFLIIGILILGASLFIWFCLIPHIQSEAAKTKRKAALITLDYLHPSFLALAQSTYNKNVLSSDQWSTYLRYYTQIINAIPNLGEAYLLAGYCSYYSSADPTQAINHFKKSLEVNPSLFWSYYNLGILMAKSGQLPQAAEIFHMALTIPPQASIQTMFQSKIYADIGGNVNNFNTIAVNQLKAGYDKVALLMDLMIKAQTSTEARQQMVKVLSIIDLQVF